MQAGRALAPGIVPHPVLRVVTGLYGRWPILGAMDAPNKTSLSAVLRGQGQLAASAAVIGAVVRTLCSPFAGGLSCSANAHDGVRGQ